MNAVTATTRTDWANKIAVMWGQARESVIETGKILLQAKKALKHGEFGAMIEKDLPFSSRQAQRLMAIANDTRLSNATTLSHLPVDYSALYQLSRLDDETFGAALERGAITPEMTTKDAERLVSAERRTEKLKNIEAKAAQNVESRRTLDEVVAHVKATNRRYAVIYFDPPWKTYTHSDKGLEKSADLNHYPTMTDEEIMALPIDDLAHKDAVLFLWSTANRVELTVDLVRKWGFKVTTFEVWDKVIAGTGHWHRDRFEPMYICTRGDMPCPIKGVDNLVESLHREAKGAHSVKPIHFRQMIDRYFPGVQKIELFARKETIAAQYPDGAVPEGWDFWGNEMPLSRADGGELMDLGTGEIVNNSEPRATESENTGVPSTAGEVALPDIDDDACVNCLRWSYAHRCGAELVGRCQWKEAYSEANYGCADFVPMMRDARRTHLAALGSVTDSKQAPPEGMFRGMQSDLAPPDEPEQPSGAVDPDEPAQSDLASHKDDDPFDIPGFLKRGEDNSLPQFSAGELDRG